MTAGQQSLNDAIKSCDALTNLLRSKKTKQVRSEDERMMIRATCGAWFNNQSPKISTELDTSSLANAMVVYDQMLKASELHGSRKNYLRNLKSLRAELIEIRSKQMAVASRAISTSDVAPSFSILINDVAMQNILSRRWTECVQCIKAPAPMAATVMMGGLLEGLLLARINKEKNQQPIFTATNSPKDKKTGNPLSLKDWGLKDFIEVAHELKWITISAKDVGKVLMEYRNYIHPQKEFSHGVTLVPDDAVILWEVAKSISKQLLK